MNLHLKFFNSKMSISDSDFQYSWVTHDKDLTNSYAYNTALLLGVRNVSKDRVGTTALLSTCPLLLLFSWLIRNTFILIKYLLFLFNYMANSSRTASILHKIKAGVESTHWPETLLWPTKTEHIDPTCEQYIRYLH